VRLAAGQAHGEIDDLVAVRAQLHPARILLGGEGLFEDGVQLHFAPAAAVLDVAQRA
jgi:hypothetical protein